MDQIQIFMTAGGLSMPNAIHLKSIIMIATILTMTCNQNLTTHSNLFMEAVNVLWNLNIRHNNKKHHIHIIVVIVIIIVLGNTTEITIQTFKLLA